MMVAASTAMTIAFEHELERGRHVGERRPPPEADRVDDGESDSLDRDPAEDVPGRDPDVVLERRGHGDRDLREVRRDGEQDRSGQGLPEVEADGEDIGHPREPDTGDPDRGSRRREDDHERRDRIGHRLRSSQSRIQ
jgi:hypothetical protein